ncbi:hypothetical protein [Pararhizobium qamdonense]|uniref:hypothetical protein n=1 Tax=Pararhizobium qamdonense TaxID=3031126 RepID=UPI0023E0F658|nr:hypothetical protein [Pararhizobium qamdonense]
MRKLTKSLLLDLHKSIATNGQRGEFSNDRWTLTWRFGTRRIENAAREGVFSIHNITLAGQSRGQGYLTELLRHIDECPHLGGRRFGWVYLEQVNFRLAGHLGRELQYKADHGLVIDCWRQVTGQLEMKL